MTIKHTPFTLPTFLNRSNAIGLSLAALLLSAGQISSQAAQAPVNLRGAARFAVLAGSEITSVPASSIKGDVGLSPAARSNITGLTAPEVTGGIYAASDGGATAVMLTTAKGDLTTAYNDAAGRTLEAVSVPNANLGGRTLAPGLYKSTGTLALTGNLTLDAGGDPNAVYIFQMASGLNTSSGSQVILSGGARAANVFWQVGTSAVIGTGSSFKGVIMADQSISFATGSSLEGRALARIGAVTLDSTTITLPVVVATAAPEFGPITRTAPNAVNLVITNTPNILLTIQSSANLTDWTTLGTRTFASSPGLYTDATASSAQRRFYRAYQP